MSAPSSRSTTARSASTRSLVNINAYHQPGVEAGKKAATAVLQLQGKVQRALNDGRGQARSAQQIAEVISEDAEAVYHALRHLAANNSSIHASLKSQPSEDTFALS